MTAWPNEKPDATPKDHGWLVEGTEKVLRRHLRPEMKVIVELGVWLGKSTRFFLDQCPDATVYSVDLWDAKHLTRWAESRHPHLLSAARRPMETFMVNLWDQRERIVPMQTDSIKGIREIHAQGVVPDIIYLDTTHLYPHTLHEIRAIKALFPDVHLVGDDWEWGNAKHGQAVEKSCREYVAEAPRWALEVEGNGWALVESHEPLALWYMEKLKELLGPDVANWAINPMQGRAMIREFDDRKAKVIVELGAGMSSLMFRQWAAHTGARVYSVDTDPQWLAWLKTLLTEKGLPTDDIYTLDDFEGLGLKNVADAILINHGTDGSHDTRIRDMPWASEMATQEGILLIGDWRTVASGTKSTRYTRRAARILKVLGWDVTVLKDCRPSETNKGVGLATRIP